MGGQAGPRRETEQVGELRVRVGVRDGWAGNDQLLTE